VRHNDYIEDYTWVMMLDDVSRRERLQYSAHLVDMTTGKEATARVGASFNTSNTSWWFEDGLALSGNQLDRVETISTEANIAVTISETVAPSEG
ncbi:unnamed protein product, partial [Symbiodinium pilosum]